jgi:hypothetical protein
MARRALTMDGDEEDGQSEQPADEDFDPDLISGATAELSEEGYAAVAMICCPLEMSIYTERLIEHLGFVVCNDGSLQGMVAWFYCQNQTRTFQELVDDSIAGAASECAWVGTEEQCPDMSPNCASFPDTTAHRRRTCRYRKMVNTTTTTTTQSTFKCNTSKAIELDFAQSTVTHNNLGGKGPGSGTEQITYRGIGHYLNASIDLVVSAVSDYEPGNSSDNIMTGHRGQISLMSGHSVDLLFQIEYTGSKHPVTLPQFYFTWLDIDESDVQHRERIYVSGFEADITEDIQDFEREMLSDGRTLYKALEVGDTWDDPADPSQLGVIVNPADATQMVDQRKRAVMLVYRHTSNFSVTLEISQKSEATPISRNFIFSGQSKLIERCPQE